VAGFRVPHKYFSHFYLVSVICSLFWGFLLWRLGWFSNGITVPFGEGEEYTMFSQLQLVWGSMLLQGFRRLLETRFFSSSSKSRMWGGHWALGLLFYLTVNMAIWVDTASDADAPFPYNWLPKKAPDAGADEELQSKLVLVPPAIFAFHALQHIYHAYLWRIRTEGKGYQLPSHPLFPDLLCPHYSCEIMIYLLLSFLAAPAGQTVNWTLACATVLAFVNLGVTSIGTKEWYAKQFGAEKVRGRKRMIPWVW
jgi:3-oxo-5-alpha-steroid 4-dehydrogenase 3